MKGDGSLLRKQESRRLLPSKSPSPGQPERLAGLSHQGRGKNGGARLSCPTDLTSRSLQGPPHPAWPSAKPPGRRPLDGHRIGVGGSRDGCGTEERRDACTPSTAKGERPVAGFGEGVSKTRPGKPRADRQARKENGLLAAQPVSSTANPESKRPIPPPLLLTGFGCQEGGSRIGAGCAARSGPRY